MSRALLFGLGVVLGLGAGAGGDPIPVGARLGGMGNAGTTLAMPKADRLLAIPSRMTKPQLPDRD